MTAAPRTWKVWASPACSSEPEISVASRDAVAMPIVMPSAPSACEATRRAHAPALDRPTTSTPDGGGHRSTGGSSRARHTAAHTCLGGTPAARASWAVRLPSSPITNCSAHGAGVRRSERRVHPLPELGVPHARLARTTSHRSPRTPSSWVTSVDPPAGRLEHRPQRLLAPEGEVPRGAHVTVGREAGAVALLQGEVEHPAGAGGVGEPVGGPAAGPRAARAAARPTSRRRRTSSGSVGSVRSPVSGSTTSASKPAARSIFTNAGVMSVRRTESPAASSARASRPGPLPISSTRAPGRSARGERVDAALHGVGHRPASRRRSRRRTRRRTRRSPAW